MDHVARSVYVLDVINISKGVEIDYCGGLTLFQIVRQDGFWHRRTKWGFETEVARTSLTRPVTSTHREQTWEVLNSQIGSRVMLYLLQFALCFALRRRSCNSRVRGVATYPFEDEWNFPSPKPTTMCLSAGRLETISLAKAAIVLFLWM